MRIKREIQEAALCESFGTESAAPFQSLHWWFGLALYDALFPLHGEPVMIDRWPEWPRPVLAHGETFELKAFELRLEQ